MGFDCNSTKLWLSRLGWKPCPTFADCGLDWLENEASRYISHWCEGYPQTLADVSVGGIGTSAFCSKYWHSSVAKVLNLDWNYFGLYHLFLSAFEATSKGETSEADTYLKTLCALWFYSSTRTEHPNECTYLEERVSRISDSLVIPNRYSKTMLETLLVSLGLSFHHEKVHLLYRNPNKRHPGWDKSIHALSQRFETMFSSRFGPDARVPYTDRKIGFTLIQDVEGALPGNVFASFYGMPPAFQEELICDYNATAKYIQHNRRSLNLGGTELSQAVRLHFSFSSFLSEIMAMAQLNRRIYIDEKELWLGDDVTGRIRIRASEKQNVARLFRATRAFALPRNDDLETDGIELRRSSDEEINFNQHTSSVIREMDKFLSDYFTNIQIDGHRLVSSQSITHSAKRKLMK